RQLFFVTLVWPRPSIMIFPASRARSIANSTSVSASITALRSGAPDTRAASLRCRGARARRASVRCSRSVELLQRALEGRDLRLELGERVALLGPGVGRLLLEGLVLELLLLPVHERALLGERRLDARPLGLGVEEPGHERLERAERRRRAPRGLGRVRGHGE